MEAPASLVQGTATKGECFATAVRKASRRLTQLYDDALAPCGLRSTQFSILVELAKRHAPSRTLSELADALVSDRSAVGHALRPLIRDGFVVLRRSEIDRRAQNVDLTDRGRIKFREGMAHWRTAQDAFVSLYGQERASAFRAAILEVAHDDRLSTRASEVPT